MAALLAKPPVQTNKGSGKDWNPVATLLHSTLKRTSRNSEDTAMRLVRLVLTVLLGMLVVMDAIVAARVAHSGWPKTLLVTASNNAAQVEVVPVHFTASAWFFFGFYGVAQLVLLYLVWRSWRSPTGTTKHA